MAENHHNKFFEENITTLVDGIQSSKLNDDCVQTLLNRLSNKKYYENVFSWDMRKCSRLVDKTVEFKTLDKIKKSLEKKKIVFCENRQEQFDIFKFYLKLIYFYELYNMGKREESLKEIEDFIVSWRTITFDETNNVYKAAYFHILHSTYAYIATSMHLDIFENIMKNIKPKSEFNNFEKSAVNGVKAIIFTKYPSISKHIAFKNADKAVALNSADAEWLNIWLLTKGPLNREYDNFAKPDSHELKIAEDLYKISKSFWHFMTVSDIFLKALNINNLKEKDKYFELSSKALLKAIELARNDDQLIFSCLSAVFKQKTLFLPEGIINDKIQILQDVNNPNLNKLLGCYYFKHKKNYDEAKKYFIRGKDANNDFECIFNLIKIECIFRNPDDFAFINMLMEYNETFSNDIRRVKIFSQILLYCTYYKKDQDKLLHFLKLFMDQPFDNAFKYRHLNSIVPIFKIVYFNKNKFLKKLFETTKIMIEHYDCELEGKKIIENTFQRFSNMMAEGTEKNKY